MSRRTERWAAALNAWRIPDRILRTALESPWSFPTELFQRRAETAIGVADTPSARRAWEALEPTGTVLDVGAGGGAASLALAGRIAHLTAVDSSAEALVGLQRRAARFAFPTRAVHGEWPRVADATKPHDVVVCHHVLYNVPDIEPFLAALDQRGRRRVVIELTQQHPVQDLNPLWLRFHGLRRPETPTAGDVEAILNEMGINAQIEQWQPQADDNLLSAAERLALVTRRLCLPPEREPDVAAALDELPDRPIPRVTLSWAPQRPERRSIRHNRPSTPP